MTRSPLALAALSTVALPGLDVRSVEARGESAGDYDVAVVIDARDRRLTVRCPRTAAAGADLEAEAVLTEALAAREGAEALPFRVPLTLGFAELAEGGRAVIQSELPGVPLRLETLRPGPGLAAELGRALAALHEVPPAIAETAGVPVYTAPEYRERLLAEVDEAAGTGKVPARLLRRWESALEDVALWRFTPTLVHGDLGPDRVLVHEERVVGITDWTDSRVADPADDLAWLLASAPQDAVDSIVEAYLLRRTELSDPHLTERALLSGELALARWLLHGVRNDLADVVADAVGMLVDLDRATAEPEADRPEAEGPRAQEHPA